MSGQFTWNRSLAGLILFLCLLPGLAQAQWSIWQERMGIDLLDAQLNGQLPTGQGVSLAIGDGSHINPASFPDQDVRIQSSSPLLNDTWHAHNVLATMLGIAPDINPINSYLAQDLWTAIDRGENIDSDIINFSVIVSDSNSSFLNNVIPAFDHVIHRDNMLMTVAVGNDTGYTPTSGFNAIYNALSVGVHTGWHNYGTPIHQNPDGRYKPDLVASDPRTGSSFTSFASPSVLSAGAVLIEHARTQRDINVHFENGDHNEVIRSILMAGAVKFDSYNWSAQYDFNGDLISPLDQVYGAGHVNLFRSYNILDAGEQTSSTSSDVTQTGWDFGSSSNSSQGRLYFFNIGQNVEDLTINLAWNRQINLNGGSEVVADLDIQLFSATDYRLNQLIDTSNTPGKVNVEHLFVDGIAPGRYAIRVLSDRNNIDYGLAWYANTFDLLGDLNKDGYIQPDDWLLFIEFLGTTGSGDYDMNDDGIVNHADFLLFQDAYNTANGAGSFKAMLQAVPEPTSLALLLTGSLASLRRRKRA